MKTPWRLVRRSLYALRRMYFARDKPTDEDKFVVVEAPPDEIVAALGKLSYAPNWEFSYYYYGEDFNLARVEYHDEANVTWWQNHVRGWYTGDVTEIYVHLEPEPTEHPREHLSNDFMSERPGRAKLRSHLAETDLTVHD